MGTRHRQRRLPDGGLDGDDRRDAVEVRRFAGPWRQVAGLVRGVDDAAARCRPGVADPDALARAGEEAQVAVGPGPAQPVGAGPDHRRWSSATRRSGSRGVVGAHSSSNRSSPTQVPTINPPPDQKIGTLVSWPMLSRASMAAVEMTARNCGANARSVEGNPRTARARCSH